MFGWGRETVHLGLPEQRTGLMCLDAQAGCCGHKLWEEQYPEVTHALGALAESHSPQDPSLRTGLSYTRLTAAEALNQVRAQGFPEDRLPSPSTRADILNRNGYRLRAVVKAKPQKKFQKPTPSSPISRNRMASPRKVDTPNG